MTKLNGPAGQSLKKFRVNSSLMKEVYYMVLLYSSPVYMMVRILSVKVV